MLHFNPLSRRTYIIISTITLLFALFGYYFWMYLPRQEEKLTAQRVRALHQISLNFIEKHKVTVKNLRWNKEYLLKKGYDITSRENISIKYNQIYFDLTKENGSTDSKDTIYTSDLEAFFGTLKRPKSFDSYLIYRQDTLVYRPIAGQTLLVPTQKAKEGSGLDFVKLKRNTFHQYQLDTNPKLSTGLNVKLAAIDYKLFATSFTTDDNTEWTIYGLVNKDTFEAAKKKLPTLSVVLLTLGILLVLFALPLLKLFFMGPLERLHVKDVVFSAASFIVCPALILITVLALNVCFVQGSNDTDFSLKKLSDYIEEDLNNEIGKLDSVVTKFESSGKNDTIIFDKKEVIYGRDTTIANKVNIIKGGKFTKYERETEQYPALNKIYWIDDSAYQKYEFTAERNAKSDTLKRLELSERSYFKEIKEGRGWRFPDGVDSLFYIEPIYSWITGDNVAIFSKPSRVKTICVDTINYLNIEVVAAQTKLHSVSDLVLPPGYSYCIVDADGKVLFHSDEKKNLQENYLAECDYDRGLRSALISEVETYVNVHYFNQDQRLYINPLKNMPWFLITAYDKEYSYVPYQHTASLTLICIFLIGLLVLILAAGFVLLQMKRSKLKRTVFYHRWLWPYKNRREKFIQLISVNVLFAIALFVYSLWEDHLVFVLSAFIYAALFSFAFGFKVLKTTRKENRFIVTTLTLTLIVLIVSIILEGWWAVVLFLGFIALLRIAYFLYDLEESVYIMDSSLYYFSFVIIAISVLLGFAFNILNTSIWNEKFWLPILLLALVWFVPYIYRKYFTDSIARTYSLLIGSYLLITSILPSLFLFDKIYNQEMLIWKRYGLYQTARNLEERNWTLKERHNHKPEKVYDEVEKKGRVYAALDYDSCKCPLGSLKDFTETDYLRLSAKTRPFYNSLSEKTNNFVFAQDERKDVAQDERPPSTHNSRWTTQRCPEHGLRIAYQCYKYPNEPDSIVLATTVPSFLKFDLSEPKLGHLWLLILVVLMVLAIYRVILFASRRFFGIDLIEHKDITTVDDQYLENSKASASSKRLFIVAPPFSAAHHLYTRKKTKGTDSSNKASFLSNVSKLIVDTTEVAEDTVKDVLKKIRRSRRKCIILENFSYNASNREVNSSKIAILESLLREKGKTVIIVSKFSPTQIYDEYERYIKLTENKSEKHELKTQVMRWRYLLSGFLQVYYASAVNQDPRKRLKDDASTEDFIKYEMDVNEHYFERFDGILDSYKTDSGGTDSRTLKEELLLKIQNMAQPYYFSLWNSCSREEKYLLYDLADDGLVNTKNLPSILHLMEKGLIYYNESLHVMNESFRNFVLSDNCKDEALEMEKELRKNGTWSIARTVILISVAGVLGFVLFAQESVIDQFIALLAGVGATLPYLLRLGGLFNSAGSSSASTS